VNEMKEAEMVEELKKRGYRVSRPKPKPVEEFKPRKVIVYDIWSGPHEIEIVRETPKFVFTEGGSKYEKKDIYEYDPEVLNFQKEAHKKEMELRDQADKLEQDAGNKIRKMLKPVYPKEGGE